MHLIHRVKNKECFDPDPEFPQNIHYSTPVQRNTDWSGPFKTGQKALFLRKTLDCSMIKSKCVSKSFAYSLSQVAEQMQIFDARYDRLRGLK